MQMLKTDCSRKFLFHWCQMPFQFSNQIIRHHTGNRAKIDTQLTTAANPVCAVTAMNAAQIQRWIGHIKMRVMVFLFQLLLQRQYLRQHLVHDFDGINPIGRIRRMTTFPGHADRF